MFLRRSIMGNSLYNLDNLGVSYRCGLALGNGQKVAVNQRHSRPRARARLRHPSPANDDTMFIDPVAANDNAPMWIERAA
jgi:hypothetical protein